MKELTNEDYYKLVELIDVTGYEGRVETELQGQKVVFSYSLNCPQYFVPSYYCAGCGLWTESTYEDGDKYIETAYLMDENEYNEIDFDFEKLKLAFDGDLK